MRERKADAARSIRLEANAADDVASVCEGGFTSECAIFAQDALYAVA